MASEREQFVRRVFDGFNARDWDAVREMTPPDFEFRSSFAAMEGGAKRGAEESLELVKSLLTVWEDLEWSVNEVREAGDRSVVLYRIEGQATESGVPLSENLAMLWSWKGGTPTSAEVFTDPREALVAAGMEGG
jgi:ketosteroid isomerase-like protein